MQRTHECTQEKYATNLDDVVDGTAVLIIIHNPSALGRLLLQYNAAQQNEF